MKRAAWLLLCAWAAWAGLAAAQTMPGLPSDDLVRQALRDHPGILAAESEVEQEIANRDRLEAGEYEWNLRLGGQQRRVREDNDPIHHYREWNATLERPLRLPGKAATDSDIGNTGIARAEAARDEARHELMRDLLKTWFAWQKENAAADQWAAQVKLIDKQAQMVKRRQQLGDASRLETIQAEAALAQTKAQWIQAVWRQQAARETLRRRYPALAGAEPANADEPQLIAGGNEEWQTAIAEHSHQLLLARQETRLAQLNATRARQNRIPDPSIGVTFSSEHSGEEHIVGGYISIPLPGAARSAAERSAQAAADAARYREAALTRQIALNTVTKLQSARAAYATWQASRSATAQLKEAATKAARAHQLGEGSLHDWLSVLRQANESELASRQNQFETLEQSANLMLDAHRIWEFGYE
ncbi:MAG: TolC family protein [Azonexus sp.]|jgi:outer membrane protein TolC|nr:TolC family protein [Azonexus sp.]